MRVKLEELRASIPNGSASISRELFNNFDAKTQLSSHWSASARNKWEHLHNEIRKNKFLKPEDIVSEMISKLRAEPKAIFKASLMSSVLIFPEKVPSDYWLKRDIELMIMYKDAIYEEKSFS